MRILIAGNDPDTLRMLESELTKWEFDVLVTYDGGTAWEVLQQEGSPPLAILDWIIPLMNGPTICRMVRSHINSSLKYLILLNDKGEEGALLEGLRAGADDYMTKLISPDELQARVQIGVRIVRAQMALAERVELLEETLARIKILQGLLPICMCCKRICDAQQHWRLFEEYIAEHSDVEFTHVICPECSEKTGRKPKL